MSENDQKIAKILSAQQWDPGANNPLLACESPIERFFVAAMLVDGWMRCDDPSREVTSGGRPDVVVRPAGRWRRAGSATRWGFGSGRNGVDW